jgi:hypothetical protein
MVTHALRHASLADVHRVRFWVASPRSAFSPGAYVGSRPKADLEWRASNRPEMTQGGSSERPLLAAPPDLRLLHRPGRLWGNNRSENFHIPIRQRERQKQSSRSAVSAQRFLTTHTAICNTVNIRRHLISRPTFRLCGLKRRQLGRPLLIDFRQVGRISTWRS